MLFRSSALKSAMTESIDKNVNKAIKTIPISQNIGFYNLNYELTDNPRFQPQYFTTDEKGEFFDKLHPTETPFNVPTLPDIVNNDMVQIFLSDYTFISAGYAAWQAGFLSYTFSAETVPEQYQYQLNTSYFQTDIPNLFIKFPKVGISAEGYVVSMPSILFNTTGMIIIIILLLY